MEFLPPLQVKKKKALFHENHHHLALESFYSCFLLFYVFCVLGALIISAVVCFTLIGTMQGNKPNPILFIFPTCKMATATSSLKTVDIYQSTLSPFQVNQIEYSAPLKCPTFDLFEKVKETLPTVNVSTLSSTTIFEPEKEYLFMIDPPPQKFILEIKQETPSITFFSTSSLTSSFHAIQGVGVNPNLDVSLQANFINPTSKQDTFIVTFFKKEDVVHSRKKTITVILLAVFGCLCLVGFVLGIIWLCVKFK